MNILSRRQFFSTISAGAAVSALPWNVASRSLAYVWDEAPVDPAKAGLIYRSKAPRNGEPQLAKLVEKWITPTPQFYIRSHGPNPALSDANFRIEINGLVNKPLTISVSELVQRFPKSSCTCTVSCAGIRRQEFIRVKPLKGVPWAEGPIGNAIWSGVRLSDVLQSVGVKADAKHVWLDGADQIVDGEASYSFGGSVPLSKLAEEDAAMPGVLLATHMNGEPLLADHGAPIRAVVPGYIGARSVKWLRTITLADRPSANHYVADAYKMVYSQTQTQLDEAAPIYRYPVNAALCAATLSGDKVDLRGYALPAGYHGCTIANVEYSFDGGKSWKSAALESKPASFCWQLWTATESISDPETEICVRATDTLGNSMPETVAWNPKGYLYNAWHRVSLKQLLADAG